MKKSIIHVAVLVLFAVVAPFSITAAMASAGGFSETGDVTTISGTTQSSTSTTLNGPESGSTYQLSTTVFAWDPTGASRSIAATSEYDYAYGDESYVTYTLPPSWSFTFYGQNYGQITADTNGNIWFGSPGVAHAINLAASGPVVSAWNDDLSSHYYGGVFVQYKTGPERVVIEWQTETYSDEGLYLPNNFQVVLYPNGVIRFNYKSFTASSKTDAPSGSGISKGDGTDYTRLDPFSAGYPPATSSFVFTSPASSSMLAVNFAGPGSGNVVSTPDGIACNISCSAPFGIGTSVTLHPTPQQYSLFSGWSNGACYGNGDCTLTKSFEDEAVTASFAKNIEHQVNIGGTTTYFPTIQAAYNAAPSESIIKLWAQEYAEDLLLNLPISVGILGGFSEDYSSTVGVTTIKGAVTISNGAVITGDLEIR